MVIGQQTGRWPIMVTIVYEQSQHRISIPFCRAPYHNSGGKLCLVTDSIDLQEITTEPYFHSLTIYPISFISLSKFSSLYFLILFSQYPNETLFLLVPPYLVGRHSISICCWRDLRSLPWKWIMSHVWRGIKRLNR